MQKLLTITLLIFLIISLFTACNPSTDVQEMIIVPLPVFGESSTSKGLNTMPIEYFENDHYLACAVMTILPTMTNLQAVEVKLTGNSFKNITLESTIFGFTVKFLPEYSHINKDGAYLQYSILYENTTVGFCDYYYNINTKKFSYRQSVCCTFETIKDNIILNMEYIDIPIDNVLEPVFKAGQLTYEGILAEDAFVDTFSFNTILYDSSTNDYVQEKNFYYSRNYLTLNEVKEDNSNLYTTYAFRQPDNSFTTPRLYFTDDYGTSEGYTCPEELKSFIDGVKSVMVKYQDEGSNDYLINTDAERKNANFKMMKEIYPLLYKNGHSIAAHHSSIKGYTSYEDFIKDSFKIQTDSISKNLSRTSTDCPRPIIYTYNGIKSKGAATTRIYGDNKSAGNDFTRIDSEGYKELGFEYYFGSCNETKVADYVMEKFLQACGIENKSYIKAFIETENKRAENPYNININYYTKPIKVDSM